MRGQGQGRRLSMAGNSHKAPQPETPHTIGIDVKATSGYHSHRFQNTGRSQAFPPW